MKKTGIIIAIVVGVILIWGVGTYNGFVKKQEAMTTAWGQVENVYQRRADLVPNLVALVNVKNVHNYIRFGIPIPKSSEALRSKAATMSQTCRRNIRRSASGSLRMLHSW